MTEITGRKRKKAVYTKKTGRPRKEKPEVPLTGEGKGKKTLSVKKLSCYETYKKARERLKIRVVDLPDNTCKKVLRMVNSGILDWVIKHPEGFQMPNEMGHLALSTQLVIPFRDDRWEIIKRVENIPADKIQEWFRQRILKKYKYDMNPKALLEAFKKGGAKTYLIWFNRRNCSLLKAPSWSFLPDHKARKLIASLKPSNYYMFNGQDFYNYKVKYIDK